MSVAVGIVIDVACNGLIIVSMARGMMGWLTETKVAFTVDIFAKVRMIVAVAIVVAVELVVPASYTVDLGTLILSTGMMIFLVADMGVDVSADLEATMRASMAIASESTPKLASPEEAFLLGCGACSC